MNGIVRCLLCLSDLFFELLFYLSILSILSFCPLFKYSIHSLQAIHVDFHQLQEQTLELLFLCCSMDEFCRANHDSTVFECQRCTVLNIARNSNSITVHDLVGPCIYCKTTLKTDARSVE